MDCFRLLIIRTIVVRGACFERRCSTTFFQSLPSVVMGPGLRRDDRERLHDPATHCARAVARILRPRKERGRRECRMRAAPAVSCATCTRKCAHEHTGQRRQSDIPCAMALRLMPSSPRRRIRLASVASGLKGCLSPVGLTRLRRLDTSNGCQDHTVLPYAATRTKDLDELSAAPPKL
jgi:hypothetical protein